MTRARQRGGEASRTQVIRAAAARALERVAADDAAPPRDLALAVLRLAVVRCAEEHHPAGRDRAARALAEGPSIDPRARLAEQEMRARLAEADAILRAAPAPDPYELGAVHEAVLAAAPDDAAASARGARPAVGGDARRRVVEGGARRRAGAHYTPPALARDVAERALDALLRDAAGSAGVLVLRVCDAATGAGAFLLAACEVLAERLARAARDEGRAIEPRDAMRAVAATCLFGVDKDPVAVALARAALWIATASDEDPAAFLAGSIRAGDALVGPPGQMPPWPAAIAPFDWRGAFPEVFGRERAGFDAIVGNPPWVSYAGRAAQPIDPEVFELFERTSPAFFGYRNLQGVFVHRAATLLRPGGRLGLVLPTSMSDLGGYEPSRRAHDALCEVDRELPDFGDRFEDVFQPCMALLSTRRPAAARVERAGAWPIERRDIDARAAGLLARLDALPKVPPETFGERGFQTVGGDVRRLSRAGGPVHEGQVELRAGSDVAPFQRKAASYRCDPAAFEGRFRAEEEWRGVRVLVRQTARFPMACLSDGLPFRNSVLAGFETEGLPAELLAAFLNTAPVRWFHYMRHRDARQGMPQLKISHLRALPLPAEDGARRAALLDLGVTLSARNDGARPEEQRALDRLAADLLGLDEEERALVAAWAAGFGG